MVDCVKSFLEIDKDATCKVFLIKVGVDLFNDAKKGMISGVFFPETKLVLINKVVLIYEMLYAVVHDSFKNFTDVGEERDGSIVSTLGFVIFLKDSAS